MNAALYVRKSTEQSGVSDDAKSVSRQIERGREYARSKGWIVADEHVYVDDGIGGAEWERRPGFMRLMNALEPRPPFDALVMSEESRIGREMIRVSYVLQQIMRAGVHVWFYLENRERTLDSPTDKFMLSATAFSDEMEREKARQRTYDAMERKAKAGYVTGGRVFGYDNQVVNDSAGRRDHVERKINESEAAVIRQIFQLRAEGHGLKAIAKILNAERRPSPRAQQGRPRSWVDSSVREALHRELYRGAIQWNRTRKRGADGQVRPQPRPEADYIDRSAPELRIVPEDLWLAAHQAMDAARERHTGRGFGPWGPGGRGSYLLTGLAKCGECGGGIEVQTRSHGSKRAKFYTCGRSYKAGLDVCSNRIAISVDAVDAALLDAIRAGVLSDDVRRAAIADVTRSMAHRGGKPAATQHERALKKLRQELDRFVTALASGESPTIATEIRNRERAIALLESQRRTAPRADVAGDPERVKKAITATMAKWRESLQADPATARRVLGALIDGRLTFAAVHDDAEGDGDGYEITGMSAAPGLLDPTTLLGVASPRGAAAKRIAIRVRVNRPPKWSRERA